MKEPLRCMTAIYLMRQGRTLLLYRQGGRVVSEVWTGSAGGHMEAEELNDPKACVLREMEEELGLSEGDISDLTMNYVTLRRTKGEIRVNYYFFARLNEEVPDRLTSNEGQLRWFEERELAALEMPFTAKHVLAHYFSQGRQQDTLYCGVTNEEGVVFTELPKS